MLYDKMYKQAFGRYRLLHCHWDCSEASTHPEAAGNAAYHCDRNMALGAGQKREGE